MFYTNVDSSLRRIINDFELFVKGVSAGLVFYIRAKTNFVYRRLLYALNIILNIVSSNRVMHLTSY